jgi:uncharacterized protein
MRSPLVRILFVFAAASLGLCVPFSEAVPSEKNNAGLFDAIRRADIREVKRSLKRGADVNDRNEQWDTPLMLAAVYAPADVMKVLLDRGADPEAKDKLGGTALMRAVGDINKVKLLLDRGVNVEARSELGYTALMVAANTAGASAVVKLLLAHNADPNGRDNRTTPPLMYAADSDIESLKLLIAAGADVNASRQNGASALLWAAVGPAGAVPLLLEKRANINAVRARDGLTPLIVAARSGATDNVRVLLEHGADVNARTQDGFTALMGAACSESGRPETVKLLLDRGADPNAKNGELTALTLAKNRGASEIVRMLTAAGAQQ